MRILVVDDNPDNREIMSTVLRHRGFEVTEAADAETALEVAATEPPDLVLMDISLPGMDGYEAAGRLRELPETASVPIIAVSAHAFMEAPPPGSPTFASYLSKPVPPRIIAEEVKRVLAVAQAGDGLLPAGGTRPIQVYPDAPREP